ncbi:hypothetical protein [Pseudidiomarina aestuarii]|uniref:hypothetical protein n=1 Tax=Pseudidiomarina aestuarii TaxID=624146 RepID=UPI003A974968
MVKRVSLSSVIGSTAVAACFTVAAQAQSVSSEQLAVCAQIENPLQRLVCFDKLAAGDQVSATEQQTATRTPEDRFGKEYKEENRVVDDMMYVSIAEKSQDPYGRWVIVLTNGQKWKQMDSTSYQLPNDAEYFIERGVLNSFYLGRTDINKRIRVQRAD